MIHRLEITNFKSWKRTDLRLAPLTGLFGTNSSGKSSIPQLLLLHRQTVESPDRRQVLHLGDERSAIELGTFRDVVHDHAEPATLSWGMEWDVERELKVPDPQDPRSTLFASRRLSFSATLESGDDNGPRVVRLTYGLGDDRFTMSRGKNGYQLGHAGPTSFEFERQRGRPWPLPPPVKSYGFPDEIKRFQNAGFLTDLELAYESLFGSVYYLGPLREHPKRRYLWSGGEPADVGDRGQRTIDALLASRHHGRYLSPGFRQRKRSLEEQVARWLSELGLIHEFRVVELAAASNLYEVRVRPTNRSTEVLLPDVGFGVSQVLPVITVCYYVPEGSVVLLEQPELHLHPAAQSGLADLLLDAVRTRNVQVILESHSEHLLSRLQRRIAEREDLGPHHVALYFCHMEDGESHAATLDLDRYGNIRNWPRGFFGDPMTDLAARARAEAEHRMAATG